MSQRLLYGKDDTSHIVSIEADDGVLEIFRETEDGIESTIVSNKFWILSNEKFHNRMIRLKGDLHYKYGIQFDERMDFTSFYQKYRNKDLYRIYDAKEASMVNKGITYFKGMEIKDVSILSFDIETTGLDPNAKDAKILLISNTFRRKGKIEKKLFAYDEFKDQGEMIEKWGQWIRKKNPSILLGHNIFSFDLPYIQTIADKNNTPVLLGRDDSQIKFNKYESKFRKEASQFIHYKKAKIYGRIILDSLFLSIKWDATYRMLESYGLKSIIKQLGLEKESRTFYDASQIRFKYKDKEEWKKIKSYAIDDADDALSLYDKMAPAYFYTAQYIPKCFTDIMTSASGSQINSILVRAYLQEGHSIPKADEIQNFQGGISMGIPGIYKNVWKADIKSSYPSCILINKLYSKRKDPNAYYYKLCEFFTNKRFEYKKLVKETGKSEYIYLDQASKIFINSLFGAMGAPGLNFNDPEIASLITKYGREYLEQGVVWATSKNIEYWKEKNNEGD